MRHANGYRPVQRQEVLLDHDVSEIMGNPIGTWYAEREGKMLPLPDVYFDPASLRTGLEVIANNLGKRLDEDNPVIEARAYRYQELPFTTRR